MIEEFVSCPNCDESVDPQLETCEHCGVNLVISALLAERDLKTSFIRGEPIQLSPEILVPRLGHYLLEKGILKPRQLTKALSYQSDLEEKGKTQLIGQTLLDLEFISKEQLDQVVTEQIIELQSALQKVNEELEDRIKERTIELENALNRLSELNQLKSNFIANVSHELRTPLTHIKGYLELLIERDLGPLTDEQSNALMVMRKSEERLETLIDDLIQFSLVAAQGDLDMQFVQFDISLVLARVVSETIEKCKNAQLQFISHIPESLPQVEADQEKINWVISQLLDNAVKFTPKGGKVFLRTSFQEDQVVISVADTGIGIPKEQIQEIFEPFHQLDGSATRRYGGTGLGLSLAKQIIEAHNSQISVQSHQGGGSIFKFGLPIA
jgi:signal transduction histidine kinase